MGLMDIVKKLLTGATDEENARNKARMRELFNECVPEGDQYTLIYCHMEDVTFQFEPITYEPGIKRGSKYAVSVTQSHAEVSAFRKFFKQGL